MATKVLSNKSNLQILYEDNHIIIINKRAGDIVQGDKTGDKPLSEITKEYLKHTYNKKGNVFLGVVHRIDRPTSGIVVFAKTSKSLTRLNRMFASQQVQKTYWAIVKNQIIKKEDTLVNWLIKNPKNNKSSVYDREIPNGKKGILHYKVIKELVNYCLLEIILETGRHHQIRAQLSKIGFPIKGDLKYGFDRSNKDGGISLHARSIEFIHPVKNEPVIIIAPLPNDPIWEACQ